MLTYCLGYEKHTYNVCSKKLVMLTNKKLKKKVGKSRCANCMAIKSIFDRIEHKSELETIVSIFN